MKIDHPGLTLGPDACFEIFRSMVRSPSVLFVSGSRLPDGKIPTTPVPQVVPDLTVEVLRTGNTFMEMSRKRHDYFDAGVRLVWMVDPRERTVAVYTSVSEYQILDESQILTGHDILPGLEIRLAESSPNSIAAHRQRDPAVLRKPNTSNQIPPTHTCPRCSHTSLRISSPTSSIVLSEPASSNPCTVHQSSRLCANAR